MNFKNFKLIILLLLIFLFLQGCEKKVNDTKKKSDSIDVKKESTKKTINKLIIFNNTKYVIKYRFDDKLSELQKYKPILLQLKKDTKLNFEIGITSDDKKENFKSIDSIITGKSKESAIQIAPNSNVVIKSIEPAGCDLVITRIDPAVGDSTDRILGKSFPVYNNTLINIRINLEFANPIINNDGTPSDGFITIAPLDNYVFRVAYENSVKAVKVMGKNAGKDYIYRFNYPLTEPQPIEIMVEDNSLAYLSELTVLQSSGTWEINSSGLIFCR